MTNDSHIPELTAEQRLEALKKARDARIRRAEIKQQLSEGTMSISELLVIEDEDVLKIKVVDALKALPGFGPKRASDAMRTLGIAESRRIGGLGIRQKEALVKAFG